VVCTRTIRNAEWNVVRERARAALHPQQLEMLQWLKKALAEVREGVAATKRLVLERCELRQDDDHQFRPVRSSLPHEASTRTKAATAQ
jgi:hypothetical protein